MPIDLSLRANAARQPKPVNVTARGNYEWSRFRALFVDSVGAGAGVVRFVADDQVDCLLFCSDYPAVVRIDQLFDGDVFVGTTKVGRNITQTARWLADGDCGGSAEIVVSPPVEQGQIARASLATAGIEVYGFPGSILVPDHEFLDASEGEPKGSITYADVSAASPLIHGIHEYGEQFAQDFQSVQMLIIPGTEYTAAIRDAGNVVELTPGVLQYVVGIFAVNGG